MLKLNSNAIKHLAEIILGENEISPYRSGPELCDFFAEFGERDLYGSGFGSRKDYTKEKLNYFNEKKEIEAIILRAFDFFYSEVYDAENQGFIFNKLLARTGYLLTYKTEGVFDINGNFVDDEKIWILKPRNKNPAKINIDSVISRLDQQHVTSIWQKALERTSNDPEGAITAAKTLLESTCKILLDEFEVGYSDRTDLPKLWALTSEKLNLSPSHHQEESFKTILGNCQSIVGTVGALRNKISDAHGQGKRPVRPMPRHAELVVNLAGTMSSFLVSTWLDKKRKPK